jgi:hypothetical protein
MKKSIPIIFGLLMAVSSPAFSEGDIDCEFIKERATMGVNVYQDLTTLITDPETKDEDGNSITELRDGILSDINTLSIAYIAFCK